MEGVALVLVFVSAVLGFELRRVYECRVRPKACVGMLSMEDSILDVGRLIPLQLGGLTLRRLDSRDAANGGCVSVVLISLRCRSRLR
jgi:hypothetical protein